MIVDLLKLTSYVVGYGAQYRKVYLERRENCFSTWSCLIVIIAQVMNLVYGLFSSIDVPIVIRSMVMLMVQLALVELLTRVKREQRMLPSTLFHRLSFRWKHFRRYFWQWDDFMSYVYVTICFGVLLCVWTFVMSFLPFFSGYLGLLNAVARLTSAFFAVPQCFLNRSEGVEGLSWVLVVAWLFGDVLVIFTTPMEKWFPLVCSLIQLVCLATILYQKFAYKRMFKAHEY